MGDIGMVALVTFTYIFSSHPLLCLLICVHMNPTVVLDNSFLASFFLKMQLGYVILRFFKSPIAEEKNDMDTFYHYFNIVY